MFPEAVCNGQSTEMETIYQLAYWNNYESACTIYLTEDRTPTNNEILDSCGEELYNTWMNTPICNRTDIGKDSASNCSGLFLRRIGQRNRAMNYEEIGELREKLQKIRFEVTNINCENWSTCTSKPELLISATVPDGEENLISEIHIRVDGFDGACKGHNCQMRMPITSSNGTWLEYWATSPDGEQGEHKWLKFRISEKRNTKGQTEYDYAIIGNAFPNQGPSGCDIWYTFPEFGSQLPEILQPVPSFEYLVTKHNFRFLTEKLIRTGRLDTSECPHYGLNEDGSPNGCGEEVAAPMVFEIQNQYDQKIFDAGKRYHVPPRVVKGLIAQESQFWPYPDNQFEYGLGCLTESGADMLLRWNTNYFLQLCLEVYPVHEEECFTGFSSLTEEQQIGLRGSVIAKVRTDEEVDMLTATIRASMLQVNQLVSNVTGQVPSEVSTYEDMWKLTIANYYSGSGCLNNAMAQAHASGMRIQWENVKTFLTGKCSKASQYVDRVYELGN